MCGQIVSGEKIRTGHKAQVTVMAVAGYPNSIFTQCIESIGEKVTIHSALNHPEFSVHFFSVIHSLV